MELTSAEAIMATFEAFVVNDGLELRGNSAVRVWDYPIAIPQMSSPIVGYGAVSSFGDEYISTSVGLAAALEAPSSKYWETLDLINRVNEHVVDGGRFRLISKTRQVRFEIGAVSDQISFAMAAVLYTYPKQEMAWLLPALYEFWGDRLTVEEAVARYLATKSST